MSAYFLMETDSYIDYGIQTCPDVGDENSFLSGKLIQAQHLPSLVFEVDFPDAEKLPHFFDSEVPLASKKFIDTLMKAGVDNFQVFPATVINPDTGGQWNDYFAFNVLGLVACANLDKSDYDTLLEGNPEGINIPSLAFNELVLDQSKLKGLLFFRLGESPIDLIVHQQVFDSLVKYRPDDGWGIDLIQVDMV